MKEPTPEAFDPNGIGQPGNIFGFPYTPEAADLVLIPVPWEVTVSYSPGTAKGPQAILDASPQLDFFDESVENAWEIKVAMEPINREWKKKSKFFRKQATRIIAALEQGQVPEEDPEMHSLLETVGQAGAALNDWVESRAKHWLNAGKKVALVGGDHSTPLGLMRALAARHDQFGILQIDAHADLRVAYEGFAYSHASIMDNALRLPQVSKLVQVGIRDYCEAEAQRIASDPRIEAFTGRMLSERRFQGISWEESCQNILDRLPEKVYVSFDIDGLDPALCPHTGTPVPGGLQFEEVSYLLRMLKASGREIIGFDLVEVAPGKSGDWDGNVGARVLWRLCLALGK